MTNKNKLAYVTYQSFPAETANSLQSITNIVELAKQGIDVELVFPKRENTCSDDIEKLKNFYNFETSFKVTMLKHNLPFKKVAIFEKLMFHISHFLWSRQAVKYIQNNKNHDAYITRSDWIFFFLAKNNANVIFECHQPSRIRKFVLSRCLLKRNAKVIFLNKNLFEIYKKYIIFEENVTILENGYRDDLFDKEIPKNKNQIVFVGQLLRFGSGRNLDFIISCFESESLNDFNLIIVGGPEEYVELIKNKKGSNIPDNVTFLGRLNHDKTIQVMLQSDIGILINSSKNIHSTKFTSPLKYFEYLAAGLKIIAVDFDSHRKLPFSDNILFFEENNKSAFIDAIKKIKETSPIEKDLYSKFSLSNRSRKLIEFARLEGLEPPTL